MADKRGSGGSKVLEAVAAFAVTFVVRKLVTFGWKQVTGKEPPTDPHDPQVGIGEALAWSVILGVGVESARLLAVRAATRKMRHAAEISDD